MGRIVAPVAERKTPRRCVGKTKKGKRCRAAPLTGRKHCLAHADEKTRETTGFGGAQPGAGRPRAPRPHEIAQQLVEAHILRVLRPYFRTLGLELQEDGQVTDCDGAIKYVWAGTEEAAIEMEDLGAQIIAAEKLLDRIYGKPRQVSEVTGEGGGPIEVAGELSDPGVREAMFEVLRRVGAARDR